MRHRTHVIYDDIVTSAGGTSDARFNGLLGEHDQLALHAVADDASAAATINIWVQHSSEGRQWLFRSSGAPTASAPGDIQLILSGGTDVQQKMWSDACLGTNNAGPLLSFVRLWVQMSTSVVCHLKVHATQRGGTVG